MPRYLIVEGYVPEEGSGSFETAYLVEGSELGLGLDPKPEQVVESRHRRVLHYEYRYDEEPIPEFKYHLTDRTSEDADWVVYYEAPNGDLICAGGVRAEYVGPPPEESEPAR